MTTPGVITFPIAAKLVLTRLRTALPALTFHHDVPNPRPATWIRVMRTGGPQANLVTDAAQLTVESWANDQDVAETNAQTVRAHVNNLAGRSVDGYEFVLVEELSGPAELPDPLSNQRRTTWTAIVHVRGI